MGYGFDEEDIGGYYADRDSEERERQEKYELRKYLKKEKENKMLEKKQYLYISAKFEGEENKREYAYICEDQSVKVGDTVRVPVGKLNTPKKVIVTARNYYSAVNAPYPVDKTKRVIEIVIEQK